MHHDEPLAITILILMGGGLSLAASVAFGLWPAFGLLSAASLLVGAGVEAKMRRQDQETARQQTSDDIPWWLDDK